MVRTACIASAAALACGAALAQEPAGQEIVVVGNGFEQRMLDTPYAVGSVDAAQIRSAGPMVNLSESMPGTRAIDSDRLTIGPAERICAESTEPTA